jgi:hypothetical protein
MVHLSAPQVLVLLAAALEIVAVLLEVIDKR